MKKCLTLVCVLFFGIQALPGQQPEKLWQRVLRENRQDSLFVFGKWDEEGGEETHLRYLGTLRSNDSVYKVVTSCWLWGISRRASNKILVFDSHDRFLGYYYVWLRSDLPEKIETNQLVFLHSESDDCDKSVITRVSFDDGIPETFFLECMEGNGDEYGFMRE